MSNTYDVNKNAPRVFCMIRQKDESGYSGTGVVLHGIVFADGTTVIHWQTKKKTDSTSIFDSFEDFEKIHIDQHPTNGTQIIWKKYMGRQKDPLAEAVGL